VARARLLALQLVLQQQPVDARLGPERREVERRERGARLLVEGGQARVARGRALEREAALERAAVGLVALDRLAQARQRGRGRALARRAGGTGAQDEAGEGRGCGARHGIPFRGRGSERTGGGRH